MTDQPSDHQTSGSRAGLPEGGATINLSLISHTNVGKTTLARTLLGRDIGEVRDEAHVTDRASGHVLLQTADAALMLWDTPGFGDTTRLLKRLRLSSNPLGWLLTEVWDRWRERPLWASQQAVRNAREQADIILYLVNAGEDPASASYVPLEMEVLSWINKPIVLLLNQIGPPREDAEDIEAESRRWRQAVSGVADIAAVLPLDAFARCWVQEGALLETIKPLLPKPKQAAMEGIIAEWSRINQARFQQSMVVLAKGLARAAVDRETVPEKSWREQVTQLLSAGRKERAEVRAAMQRLSERLEAANRAETDTLIGLHALSGQASRKVLERMETDYARREKAPEGIAAALGGIVSGATTGLAADLASGGLTLGGGLIVGTLVGALGAGGIAKGFNLVTGAKDEGLRWSQEFFAGLVGTALLRYLAVAHFGRGRGEWQESEYPPFWQDMVRQEVEDRKEDIQAIYKESTDSKTEDLVGPLAELLSGMAAHLLARLYPGVMQPDDQPGLPQRS